MRSFWLIIPFTLLCTAQMRADSVTLATGEKISGTIKSETATEITIDVPVSASITDERVIRKADISKIDKEQPDQIAYQQLILVQPNAQLSYSSKTYDQILASLTAFQTNYPNSNYLPEIKKLAKTYQDEKKRVDAGQIKYLGQWLTPDEAARERDQIVALETYNTMQQQAAAGDLVGAMQTFDAIEHNYSGTRAYVSAVTFARQVLPRIEQDLAIRMQQVKADQAQLKSTIAFTAEPDKSRLIAASKAEQDRATATVEEAVKSGVKWAPLIPRSQISVETLQKTVTAENQRLENIPVAAMTDSLGKVDEARLAFATGDFKTADQLLKDAAQLWAQNEAARYWADQLKAKVAVASATPVRSATPKPLPSVPRPKPMIAASPAAVPEDKPFYMTISGAITIALAVLVIGGLGAAYSKRQASRQASE